jgi:hypothetical protein
VPVNAEATMSNPPTEVLDLPPEDLLAWIQLRLGGEVPLDTDFNWHGLADVAAMRAHEQDASPIWAEIAVRVYAWLAHQSEPRISKLFTLSEMHVRAHQVSSLGACAGHAVREPQALVAWFHKNLPLSYTEASAKAAHWRQLPVSEIAQLRDIKSQLGVFEALLDQLNSSDRNELERWLKLRPHLP